MADYSESSYPPSYQPSAQLSGQRFRKEVIEPRIPRYVARRRADTRDQARNPDNVAITLRFSLLLALTLSFLLVFVGRLVQLQILNNTKYNTESAENHILRQHISPLRGRILARDGTILADNRIAVDLMYTGGDIAHWQRIARMLRLDDAPLEPNPSDIKERLEGKVQRWDIASELIPALEELVAGQENLYLRKRIERIYPQHEQAAQLIGHTTLADPERFKTYHLGDMVGLNGIEAGYQQALFGTAGTTIAEIDNRNHIVRELERVQEPIPGADITLTIDPALQQLAEAVLPNALEYVNAYRERKDLPEMDKLRAAFIALDPRNGEILAMASYPAYDPNIFTRYPILPENTQPVLNDSAQIPMLNRAVSAYPPASTFKLVTSLALLEHGRIQAETVLPCSGYFTLRDVRMGNWAGYYRGDYTVAEAIADSCNTFYWAAAGEAPDITDGWSLYAEELTDFARYMGYGKTIGIGLPEEKTGLVPDNQYSKRFNGYAWRPGDSLNISVGQGDMLATPLQVTQTTATIAMNGLQMQPHLIKKINDTPSNVVQRQIDAPWQPVQHGMRLMITGYGGRKLLGPNNFPIAIAGKTGTAQNGLGVGYEHAWFTAYAPYDGEPEIVATVLIENGGSSTAVAIPVVRDFLAGYYDIDEETEE